MSAKVYHVHLWGARKQKYEGLLGNDVATTDWEELDPAGEFYLFVPRDEKVLAHYEKFVKVTEEARPLEGGSYTPEVPVVQRYLEEYFRRAGYEVVSSAGGALTREHRKIYLRSQLYTTGLIGASLFVCILFPEFLLRFLFKIMQPSAEMIGYTRWMAVVMAIATLLNINVFLLMAQRRFRLLSIAVASAVLYLAGVYFHHGSAYHIIAFAGIANLIALGVTTAGIVRGKGGQGAEENK